MDYNYTFYMNRYTIICVPWTIGKNVKLLSVCTLLKAFKISQYVHVVKIKVLIGLFVSNITVRSFILLSLIHYFYCCANDITKYPCYISNDITNCPCLISYLRSIAETGIKPGRSDNIQWRRTTITESWPSGQTHLNIKFKANYKIT